MVEISSPLATGGAGTFFEQHVGAYWLAQLLVGAIPPILIDCSVVEVHFQTEHLGWQTDDFLVVSQTGLGKTRKLAGQVKRSFTVSRTDTDCKGTVQGLWKDFKSPDRFSPQDDRLAIVTQRGTNTLLEHLGSLLDCARAANDGDDLGCRISTSGFISAKAVHYCDELRSIVGDLEHRDLSVAEIWPFLRALYILSFDLATATRQTEALIKSLLAYTAAEEVPLEAATNSWNSLLALASEAMSSARAFRRQDLPASLRGRHSPSDNGQRMLRALQDHTAVILRGIHSTVGSGLHLSRAPLVQKVIEQLGESQAVLLSGPAGAGKSAVAKDVVRTLSNEYFAFCFRAEEFAEPHFDATLHNAQIPGSGTALAAILASQDRKVLLIESVERLLEKSTRDAFTDLLALAANDRTLRIILTCRDYSTDLVRSCFLHATGVDHSVVAIPTLNDDELKEVESVHSVLSGPLAKKALRQILRNPYILDKALRIQWSPDRSVPESEREFRNLFWQEIVRVEHRMADGMPTRRDQVFSQIALRRARNMTLYVAWTDLDPAVIAALRADSLLTFSERNDSFAAPAHDVLEDWAILRWIEGQHSISEGSLVKLCEAVGTHPAVRRGYRGWVSELLEFDPASADRLFQDCIADKSVPANFRDDTLISILRAQSSPNFLENHATELLANDNELLRRIIHLLRVACVKTPSWLTGKETLLNLPDGSAWQAVLKMVKANLARFKRNDFLLLLGLIEDWSSGVSPWEPCPKGADSAAAIAHFLLPHFDNYASEKDAKRILRVIAKAPNGDPERFEHLLRGGLNNRRLRNRISEELREMILAGMDGMAAARYMPEVIVAVILERVLCSESDLHSDLVYAASLDLYVEFGLKPTLGHDYFPASAFRTPVLPLLRHHPRLGLEFLVSVFNHSAEWYAHPRVQNSLEPAFEIELRFGDQGSQEQWANPRLWNLYRGTSVGPYLLQSFLMALERWLFELADAAPQTLDSVLLNIMRRSQSGALTAVVASVATAHPHNAGETLLTFLRSPACISLDRQRLVAESNAASSLLGGLVKSIRPENRVYQEEREHADSLPHRTQDLEAAIMQLQLGPLAARVHEVLDEHRRALPPVSEQCEEHRIWRIAMHRMDLRQYSVSEKSTNPPRSQVGAADSVEPNEQYIRLEPKDPEPDVKKMVDESTSGFAAMNAKLALAMWGLKVFKHEDIARYDPNDWRPKLQLARQIEMTTSDMAIVAQGGPGIVAAVCVRDHLKELGADERAWCVERVCLEIERESNNWNDMACAQRFERSADRACAWVVAALVGKFKSEALQQSVSDAFVLALTHPTDEVRWFATWGIAEQLWQTDPALALRSANAVASEAKAISDLQAVENAKPYTERRPHGEISADAAASIRQAFWKAGSIAEDAYARLDIENWYGAEANNRILAILGKAPAEPVSIAAFTRAARRIAECWKADDDYETRGQRNREAELATPQYVQEFVMRVQINIAESVLTPILNAVDVPCRDLYWFVEGLIGIEDREPNTDHFWALWELFARRVKQAEWIASVDDKYSTGQEVISAIFLGAHWKEDVRHWRSLEGHAHHVHSLFESLPCSSTVFEEYVRFLYHVGEQSLPESFVRLARRLKEGDTTKVLAKGNTVSMLETLLQRHVYSKPLELKQERDLREAVLFLLDQLVDNGSSASFRMRDDFVTPISVG